MDNKDNHESYITYERWVDVYDDDRYEVSNFGRVRNKKKSNILVPQLNKREGGRYRVTYGSKRDYVHRIVARSFFGGDDYDATNYDNLQVNHIDGNPANNHLSNLEWCTPKENIRHAYINGLKYPMTITVVRCKFCKHRGEFDICTNKDDSFYCSYGER